MGFIVVRYSERPELWEGTAAISSEVWPEYNLHGEVLSPSWRRIRPRFQGGGLADRMLDAMSDIGREAGLAHLIAPVRPRLKHRYPINL